MPACVGTFFQPEQGFYVGAWGVDLLWLRRAEPQLVAQTACLRTLWTQLAPHSRCQGFVTMVPNSHKDVFLLDLLW